MLSLVAGSAIDEYLLSQMRLLKQPHTVARIIHAVQTKLWPGGVWFQHTDHYHQTHPVSFCALPGFALPFACSTHSCSSASATLKDMYCC